MSSIFIFIVDSSLVNIILASIFSSTTLYFHNLNCCFSCYTFLSSYFGDGIMCKCSAMSKKVFITPSHLIDYLARYRFLSSERFFLKTGRHHSNVFYHVCCRWDIFGVQNFMKIYGLFSLILIGTGGPFTLKSYVLLWCREIFFHLLDYFFLSLLPFLSLASLFSIGGPLGPPLLPWEIIASRNLPGTQSLADLAQRLLTTADTKTLPLRASKLWALLLSPSKPVLPEQN